MIKFTRSTKKKLDKVRHNTSSGTGRDRSRGPGDGRSVSSAYSTHSTRSDYTDGNSGGGKGTLGGMSGDNNNRRK